MKIPATFADLIAPIDPATFFADYYGKKPLYIPAKDSAKKIDKIAELPDWQGLSDMLNQNVIWSGSSLQLVLDRQLLPPAEYCQPTPDRNKQTQMQPDAKRVMGWLERGASLIANDIDCLTPGLRRVSGILEDALDGKAQANLYCSWRQRQAFNSHYDTHDVFALHVLGQKRWKVYHQRDDWPIRHRRYTPNIHSDKAHEQRRGDIALDVTLQPGDLLYIPRGQYHDALASSDGTVHIAFGVTSVIGLDILELAADRLVDQSLFRQNLPRTQDGVKALQNHLRTLGQTFLSLAESPEFAQDITAWQQNWRYPRGGISLPVQIADRKFALTGGFTISEDKGQVRLTGPGGTIAIPPNRVDTTRWVVQKKNFSRADFMDQFAHLPGSDCDHILDELLAMKVICDQDSSNTKTAA